ncbi:Crp/Fnr family transcriptional regulator [Croceicoccus naphthovorans]|uniref:Crp/Fnr family transcriptional regulator n=1 Tax=Croceicoccus naphthovorans TaxID=1348774 RepID=A0A0G3XEH8_9SPHN|nr:Crp/Fnr family transcriptional regulator [Croceicoccus naphthovorans]AKM09970.1 Crp/Fnr family transcriptional regulator [Croceicoccus naphthovorans]MBB3990863.1 CRP-like cAMP-binding protein [Croceicoccus naphthovorans]
MQTVDISRLGDLLPQGSLFADCSDEELGEIVARGQVRQFPAGKEIMAQGEEGDALFILLSGTARVSVLAANGREIVLDYAEAGEVLGEIAMIDGGLRTASVHAFTECEALRLTRGAFAELTERHPQMAMRLMQALARRLRQTNLTIEAERAYTSGPRLARFLLRLMIGGAEDGQSADGGARLRLALSQGELGNFAGMSREQINRQLSAWVDCGIVALNQGRVTILDREALIDIAEEW